MKFIEKHPMTMIITGIFGISLSAIFVKFSEAPSAVTAAYRLVWTVLLMSPVALGQKKYRSELFSVNKKTLLLCAVSGIFLAFHFFFWFASLSHTSVASSTVIVCTEVIWVALGYCIFMKGTLGWKAVLSILATFLGSILIAFSDYNGGENHLYGDILSLAAAVFVAVYTLLGGIARRTMTTTAYTYLVYVFSGITLIALVLLQGQSFTGWNFSPIIVGLLLSIFSTLLGHSIFSWCLKYFSPAFVSASKLCEPVVAGFIAMALFQEIPAPLQLIGSAVILGSVLYYSYIENKALQKKTS